MEQWKDLAGMVGMDEWDSDSNRVILALPADYEPLPGPMRREKAADMCAHVAGVSSCDAAEISEELEFLREEFPKLHHVVIPYSSLKQWELVY